MKYLLGAASALAISFAATAAQAQGAEGCDDGETVVKFSHVVADSGHPKGDAARELAKRVNEQMDGKMCMEVFANSTLYDDDKVLEAMLLGDVQLAAPSLSKFEAYTKKYRLYDLPFLFASLESVNGFNGGETGQELLNAMTDQGYVGLGYMLSGLKQFSAKQPLEKPEDANGLKFRIQTSDVADAMIGALGASAQKLAFKEVYGALQTGVVDGQENSWCNIFTQKFFEVQDGITETNHALLAYLVVTSQDFLDSLDEDVRTQFLEILDQTLTDTNAQVADKEATCRQQIIDAGATIRELTPEQRQGWVDAMQPVYDRFKEDVGGDEVIQSAQSANEG